MNAHAADGALGRLRDEGAFIYSRRTFAKAGALALAGAALGMGGAGAGLAGCANFDEAYNNVIEGTRTIVDDMGRSLEIPVADALQRIYFTSGLAQVWVFSLDPSKQGGSSAQFTDEQLQYLPEGIEKLPYMGSISENAQIDAEQLIEEDIQLIFSISGVGLTQTNLSDAETLQEQTRIPVVLVDGSFTRIAEAYRFVGDIMGCAARAEELATYCEQKFAEVTDAVAKVADDERITLYYAEGPEGLQTEPDSSQHALTFKLAGAVNVAQVEEIPDLGMSNVSLEHVLKWDPEVIVAWDRRVQGGADKLIREEPEWADISAVKTGRVYTMPASPFAWCDRPPGVNRLIGIQWIANLLYPQHYDVDMVEVVKDFYKKMYWADVTDEQARELLGNSYPVR